MVRLATRCPRVCTGKIKRALGESSQKFVWLVKNLQYYKLVCTLTVYELYIHCVYTMQVIVSHLAITWLGHS